MSRRIKLLRVTKDVMLEMMEGRTFLLGLPWDSRIIEVDYDIHTVGFVMIIENERFPPVEEGQPVPKLTNDVYTTGRKGPAKIVADQSRDDDLWLETDEVHIQLLQQALRELHNAFERPDTVAIPSPEIVHILHGGTTLCGYATIPLGHRWVAASEAGLSNCESCIKAGKE